MEALLIFFGIYLGICWLVGMYANSKGRSAILFTLISFVLSPVLGFIIAMVVNNEKKAAQQHTEMMEAMAKDKVA